MVSHSGHCYLCNTDEDDEDGRRAAVCPLQVLAADVLRQHPSGDGLLELLTAPHLSAAVGLVPDPSLISVHGKRLLLLEVDVPHHCSGPTQQIQT